MRKTLFYLAAFALAIAGLVVPTAAANAAGPAARSPPRLRTRT